MRWVPPIAVLTRQRGGSYVRGEKTGHRPPGQTKVCPHTAAITHLQTADKLAAIMRILALDDYDLPGSHTRSLSFQRQSEAIESASDGQPENCVGNFWRFPTPLPRKNVTRSVSGSIPTRERGNDQLRGLGDWSAVRPPSLASQLLQGLGTSARNWSAGRPGFSCGRISP